ncbi:MULTISPECIES: MATE family efflux transporter [Achromobacter]|uniref:MATE family efflux transporter n=1 Tax=Achromobacter spanius TaxID=217203 RepID=A0ABY8GWY4_9BURK|nr:MULTISPECIES: MATE family efflux transporter [Achromobacter]WAI81747.1 MATE family efflux transporter [Achromobacter spanius]WEX97264.1 MATE family efflux transporter [Achromobacter sp. SS2-2022]WFP09019.1 MATE family efflux transporter [Achromobacter spanius]
MTAQTDSRSRDVQTERLLTAPILPVMLSLAGPTLLVMLSQTLVGLMEVWFLSQLGEDVLAGVSVVFPLLALTTALATGSVGGGMLGAVARALGRNDRVQANALVWHAVAIAVAFGLVTAGLVLAFGTVAFSAMGASGAALAHADHYAAVVFGGAPLIWLFNALLAVIRGSGNVRLPMRVVCGGGVILIPVSWLLIFGVAKGCCSRPPDRCGCNVGYLPTFSRSAACRPLSRQVPISPSPSSPATLGRTVWRPWPGTARLRDWNSCWCRSVSASAGLPRS